MILSPRLYIMALTRIQPSHTALMVPKLIDTPKSERLSLANTKAEVLP
jgi:hypothetical protein